MNNLTIENTALATYEVTDGEVLANELFTHLILTAREHRVLNLDLLLAPERIASERTLLENAGFSWTGTQQVNRDGHSVLLAKFRICVKRSSDGVAAGGGNTTLAPSSFEQQAIEGVRQQMSQPLSDARLAQLTAMGKQDVEI
jgi:hypothetical protein